MSQPSSVNSALQRRYLLPLAILLFLFCLRVLGQILVVFFHATYLPPPEEWLSGVLPYPGLLTAQIFIILLYGKVCLDFARGSGFFVTSRRLLGTSLLIFGELYFSVMVIRYIIRMTLYPHERWTGGCIPIFFHWVLSSFIIILGTYHRRTTLRQAKPTITIRILQINATLAVILFITIWVSFLIAPSRLAHQLGLRPSEYAARAQKHTTLLTSDGASRVVDIYHPVRTTLTPTILVQPPSQRSTKNSLFTNLTGRLWAEHGYTTVVTTSTTSPENQSYPDERKIVESISKQKWFNGQIYICGPSAFGPPTWCSSEKIK